MKSLIKKNILKSVSNHDLKVTRMALQGYCKVLKRLLKKGPLGPRAHGPPVHGPPGPRDRESGIWPSNGFKAEAYNAWLVTPASGY